MRFHASFGLSIYCLLALGLAPAQAADCTADVVAAFEKQRKSKVFRIAMTQPTAEGEVQITVDYMPPDRMMQTVKSPAMPGDQQTILVGNRAFAGSGGAFEELLPQFTQSIISEFNSAMGSTGKDIGAFDCLGKAPLDGKDFLAFRAVDKSPPLGADAAKVLARTIYVDQATGLPAYNVVAAVSGSDAPVMKATFSYPDDVVIEAPPNAPVQKFH